MEVVLACDDQILNGDPQAPIPGVHLTHGDGHRDFDDYSDDQGKSVASSVGSVSSYGKSKSGESAYKLIIVSL
jgi:hypothetical protein